MCGKMSVALHLLATCLLLSQANGFFWNSTVKVHCSAITLKYEQFPVNFYFSSRNKKNQLYNPDYAFVPEQFDFDPSRRTTILVHGFLGSSQAQHFQGLTSSLIKYQDTNVINVDWSSGSSDFLAYHQAVVNTEYAAIQIRRLFDTIMNHYKNTAKSVEHWGPIHFVGFSVGAHVAGQAAELLKSHENLLVDRLTGLDPAEPCFQLPQFSSLRIKSSNAKFVDVIHTDATTKREQGFALRNPIGHVDFYVNGGNSQPGCEIKQRRKRTTDFVGLSKHALLNGICHHERAIILFRESVIQARKNGCKFLSRPWKLNSKPAETKQILQGACTSCVEMGILAENHRFTSNIYYLPTTGQPPYCAN